MSLGLSLCFTRTKLKTHRLPGEIYIYHIQKCSREGQIHFMIDKQNLPNNGQHNVINQTIGNEWILLFYHPVLIYCQSHDLLSILSATSFLFLCHLHRRKHQILKLNMLLNPEFIFSRSCLLFPYFINSHILFLNGP